MRGWCALGLAFACHAGAVHGAPPRPVDDDPATSTRTIVMIGGARGEASGRHEHSMEIERLMQWVHAAAPHARVQAYPNAWPSDPHTFDDAATIVISVDGLERHPLRDPMARRRFEAAMARGVGLVAVHQATTVTADERAIGLGRWLGVERRGTFDRTTEIADVTLATPAHPVLRGIDPFAWRDEFYPTVHVAAHAGRLTPLLGATLHVQYRDGHAVLDDSAEPHALAWAFERARGGRSFTTTGGHFIASFDEPMVQRLLTHAVLWTAGIEVPAARGAAGAGARVMAAVMPAAAGTERTREPGADAPTFHHDAQRSGWHDGQRVLKPANVGGSTFGALWSSPVLAPRGRPGSASAASATAIDPPAPVRLYASPLYIDRLTLTAGPLRGETFSVAIAATNLGDVFAIATEKAGDIAPGRILWRTHLAEPCRLQPAPLDAVPTGILATPVIDLAQQRLYVTHCDPAKRWQAYALELGSGTVIDGWPVMLDEARFNALNRNAGPTPVAPTRRFDFRVQRGALALSPDGTRLYATFGETETGWLASIATVQPALASAFAAVAMPHRGSGGIWGAGGAAIDERGHVYVVTGSGFNGHVEQPGDWTQSVLKLSDDATEGLRLEGTYSPFNHCVTAQGDIDLGSGGAALLPLLEGPATSVRALMVVGGKQGNAYLLDRDHLPGPLDARASCSDDASTDRSLLPPIVRAPFTTRAPLNVFGPYSETDAALDVARARSVPASFRDAAGRLWVYMTGTTRSGPGLGESVAPSLVKLAVVMAPNAAPYLDIDRAQPDVVMHNPGSPVVTSDGPRDAIVWVLDENARRSASLAGGAAPRPVLYAFDANTLALLWRSAPGALRTSGKYNEPVFARDAVIVGTDRLQAFGPNAIPVAPTVVHAVEPAPPTSPSIEPKRSTTTTPVGSTNSNAPIDIATGAALYKQRCAACHDNPQGRIPPRAWLATRAPRAIVDALTTGVMAPMATGLDASQIDAIARALVASPR